MRKTLFQGLLGCCLLWLPCAIAAQEQSSSEKRKVEQVKKQKQRAARQKQGNTPPRQFKPSESISADSAVSFPVDI